MSLPPLASTEANVTSDNLDQAAEPATILIVDDDLDWLAECAFMLEGIGLRSVGTSSPQDAIRYAAQPDISLVIVDYDMPGCDGLELISQLSILGAQSGRQLRFIMATGHATLDLAVDAMRASAVDFLQKPVSRDVLQKALQRANGLADTPTPRIALMDKISALSSELQRITQLIDDKPGARAPALPGQAATSAALKDPVTADFIHALLRNEAKRRQLGGGTLFGDPAWVLLLDLLLAKIEGRTVSVSSACIATGAPTTTALRLINRLISGNILFRWEDEHDRRRNFLGIHPEIEQTLLDYLAEQKLL
ncbi:MAG TPA: response regulator [Sphingobium sp.]|nr:response regulator [Sphingobium sp.]